jgi:hypothetical protein
MKSSIFDELSGAQDSWKEGHPPDVVELNTFLLLDFKLMVLIRT